MCLHQVHDIDKCCTAKRNHHTKKKPFVVGLDTECGGSRLVWIRKWVSLQNGRGHTHWLGNSA